jgi:hypothetical protein
LDNRLLTHQEYETSMRALDGGDAEAYAATFTPDGQFGRDEKATRGRDALKRMITDMRARNSENDAKAGTTRPAMYHVITNPHVEFIDKDHARFQAYWMTVFAAPGENPPARVAAAGREVDELVRLNGQWLIKLRDVSPKD